MSGYKNSVLGASKLKLLIAQDGRRVSIIPRFFCPSEPSVQTKKSVIVNFDLEGKPFTRARSCGEVCLARNHESAIDNKPNIPFLSRPS